MLSLPAIFSNHMVLQRNKKIAVWGCSDGRRITATLGCNTATTEVKEGKWFLYLPPINAGGPYTLQVTDGIDTILYEDVMIGEVWLAGGQSNMEFELQGCKDGEKTIANAKDEGVRFYYTPKISWVGQELFEEEKKSSWQLCLPDTCGKWSAVGYYYAKKLTEKLGVTVGVIGCNWGGTSASCWMSRDALESRKSLSSYLEEYDFAVANQDEETYLKELAEYKAYQSEFDKNVGEYYRTCPNPTWEEAISLFGENRYPGPMGPRNERRPAGLYESMLKRVIPYTLAGFIFYQAEEDDHKPYIYADLFETLIACWRKDWGDESLPFIFVQLPMFADVGEEDYKNWAFLREAQMKVFNTVKNTGIAVVLDMGEYGNIHPTDKKPVGERLAYQALYQVYNLSTREEAFGPIYKDYMVKEEKLYILFDNVYGEMKCTADMLTGFEIAGEDKKYYAADADFVEAPDSEFPAQIVVSCSEVEKPVYARYCWTNYSEVTLFGENGIPVAPFRTSCEDGAVATGSRQGIIL